MYQTAKWKQREDEVNKSAGDDEHTQNYHLKSAAVLKFSEL